MKRCRCGAETDALCGVCPACITASVDRERTEQGLPLVPSEETIRRLAVILRPAMERAS